MSLRIYDPLRKRKVEFKPVNEGKVGMYFCGMTVQSEPHIGHMLAALTGDMVRSYLEYLGYEVTHIQNFTDIGDSVLEKALEEGVDYKVVAERNIDLYFEQARALNIRDASIYPRATEHIPEMLKLIERLVEREHAYDSEEAVYFAVRSYDNYGQLSGRKIDDLYSGVRVEVSGGKRDELDFALWKKCPADEPGFDSPWGRGRPGWHIECSAMASRYCGETVDLHGGGLDLKFPHHENERAQSEAANCSTFANFWLHNGMLTVGGEKMSKSLGNYVAMGDLLERYNPEVLRFYLLSTHFRSRSEFEEKQLVRAEGSLDRIREFSLGLHERLAAAPEHIEVQSAVGKALADATTRALERWREAMDDDFNTGGAIGRIFELVKEFNRLVAADDAALSADREALVAARDALETMAGVLRLFTDGLPIERKLEIPPQVTAWLAERDQARVDKDWAGADRLRDLIHEAGFVILDGPEGSKVKAR
ncbi:MAG: cysteine--tRNA ligase [bacterium]|nr:cysteine--tRNA ligase [bacterium]